MWGWSKSLLRKVCKTTVIGLPHPTNPYTLSSPFSTTISATATESGNDNNNYNNYNGNNENDENNNNNNKNDKNLSQRNADTDELSKRIQFVRNGMKIYEIHREETGVETENENKAIPSSSFSPLSAPNQSTQPSSDKHIEGRGEEEEEETTSTAYPIHPIFNHPLEETNSRECDCRECVRRRKGIKSKTSKSDCGNRSDCDDESEMNNRCEKQNGNGRKDPCLSYTTNDNSTDNTDVSPSSSISISNNNNHTLTTSISDKDHDKTKATPSTTPHSHSPTSPSLNSNSLPTAQKPFSPQPLPSSSSSHDPFSFFPMFFESNSNNNNPDNSSITSATTISTQERKLSFYLNGRREIDINPLFSHSPVYPIRVNQQQQTRRYGDVQFTMDDQQLQQLHSQFTTVEAPDKLKIPLTMESVDGNELSNCRILTIYIHLFSYSSSFDSE